MFQRIARCLAWLGLLPTPRPQGRHRAVPAPRVPVHRRPRRPVIETPIDGDASPLVRPYLVAHEQRERREALLLATFGVDAPGPYWIHGVEVAR
ncbi:hypothetical protein JK360_36630 [Streptomyces sp. 9-7]|uniref:Uncharacterized protein n=1 Tax=Streptomyces siderophoricus TaxID=2802281 RepID=A0ABS1N402_9ACTN|nr:hypothetical protein [Streptomyces sp. 9-7]